MKTVQQLLVQMEIALWYVKPQATVFEARDSPPLALNSRST